MSEVIKGTEVYRLPKDLTLKWLEALRSDEYKQGPDSLKRVYKEDFPPDKPFIQHCCLGVLAEVCKVPDQLIINVGDFGGIADHMEDEGDVVGDAYLKSQWDIPTELIRTDLARVLMAMNDGGHKDGVKTFTQIADWIEANVELY